MLVLRFSFLWRQRLYFTFFSLLVIPDLKREVLNRKVNVAKKRQFQMECMQQNNKSLSLKYSVILADEQEKIT